MALAFFGPSAFAVDIFKCWQKVYEVPTDFRDNLPETICVEKLEIGAFVQITGTPYQGTYSFSESRGLLKVDLLKKETGGGSCEMQDSQHVEMSIALHSDDVRIDFKGFHSNIADTCHSPGPQISRVLYRELSK